MLILSILLIVVMLTYTLSNITYALPNYAITFNRAEGTEVMKVCTTDVNGKLTEECLGEIAKVCAKWSIDKWDGVEDSENQIDLKTIDELRNMKFSKDQNYYCKAKSSQIIVKKNVYM